MTWSLNRAANFTRWLLLIPLAMILNAAATYVCGRAAGALAAVGAGAIFAIMVIILRQSLRAPETAELVHDTLAIRERPEVSVDLRGARAWLAPHRGRGLNLSTGTVLVIDDGVRRWGIGGINFAPVGRLAAPPEQTCDHWTDADTFASLATVVLARIGAATAAAEPSRRFALMKPHNRRNFELLALGMGGTMGTSWLLGMVGAATGLSENRHWETFAGVVVTVSMVTIIGYSVVSVARGPSPRRHIEVTSDWVRLLHGQDETVLAEAPRSVLSLAPGTYIQRSGRTAYPLPALTVVGLGAEPLRIAAFGALHSWPFPTEEVAKPDYEVGISDFLLLLDALGVSRPQV